MIGSALVVALTNSGKKFGGFNPLGWSSSDDYGASNSAFLWFPKGGDIVVKCPVLTGGTTSRKSVSFVSLYTKLVQK